MDLAVKEPARNYVIGAWLIAAALLWLVLRFDLLPALLAGLLVFELVHVLTMRLHFVRERRARIVAVAFIAVVVVGLLSLATFASLLFFRSDTGGYVLLLKKSADVIQSWRGLLPAWLVHTLPTDADGPAGQHRRVAEGAPRRRADVRPGRNEGPGPGADRHGHRRAHRLAPGRSAARLPAARARARQSRRPLRRGVSPRRLRAGPDRGAERGADRVLPGDRAAAPRHPAAAGQDDDRA